MHGPPPGPDGHPGLSALALGCVLEDVDAGAVVWVLGEGEDELARGLAARGAEVRRLGPQAEPPAGLAPPALVVVGEAAPSLCRAAVARAHAAGCPFVYTRHEAACRPAREGYWCHQVPSTSRTPSLAETYGGRTGAGAAPWQNRYGHWVGWRRTLPAGQGSPGTLPAPASAP